MLLGVTMLNGRFAVTDRVDDEDCLMEGDRQECHAEVEWRNDVIARFVATEGAIEARMVSPISGEDWLVMQ